MVEDPNLAQHLAHFGINITQMEKVCDKQILSGFILESNIWSLSHFFIALVKARLLNWLKCLDPIILQNVGIIFSRFFRREKTSAKRARSARHTRQDEGAFRHRVCLALLACFVLRSPVKWAPVLKTRTTPISLYSVSLPYFSIAFVNFCQCPFCW